MSFYKNWVRRNQHVIAEKRPRIPDDKSKPIAKDRKPAKEAESKPRAHVG